MGIFFANYIVFGYMLGSKGKDLIDRLDEMKIDYEKFIQRVGEHKILCLPSTFQRIGNIDSLFEHQENITLTNVKECLRYETVIGSLVNSPSPYTTNTRTQEEVDRMFQVEPERINELKQVLIDIYAEEEPSWYFFEACTSTLGPGTGISKVKRLA